MSVTRSGYRKKSFCKRPTFDSKLAIVAKQEPVEKVTDRVTENQSLILKGMKENKQITSKTLAESVGISERKIKGNIKLLKNKGLLNRVGPARGGHWVVVDG